MGLVHTLVAEVLAHFIDTLETAHDESFQVEFRGDAHVHILIERIEMGDERTGRGTAGDILQDRRIHLRVAGLVEDAAHGADDGGTLQERVLHAVVDHQVNVALAIAQFRVVELVVGHAVLIFHDGQRFEALREQCDLLCVDGNLARLRTESEALHTDEVTDVEEFLEHRII